MRFHKLNHGLLATRTDTGVARIMTHEPYWLRYGKGDKQNRAAGAEFNSKRLNSSQVPDPTALKGDIKVGNLIFRRVVGITQNQGPKGFFADGSYFHNVKFDQGRVQSLGFGPDAPSPYPNGEVALSRITKWNSGETQNAPGPPYEPSPANGYINPKRSGAPWKNALPWSKQPIDFSAPYKLKENGSPSGATQTSSGVTRFEQEVTHINLHPGGKYTGKLVRFVPQRSGSTP